MPLAYDHSVDKGSVTLLFAYGSFLMAMTSIGYLTYTDPLQGALTATAAATIYLVLYRLRALDKVKITKDSFEVDSEDEDAKSTEK